MPAPNRRDGNAVYYNQTDPPRHHFIEQAVTVYLRLSDDGTRWIVDGPSVDGWPLNSAHEDLRATELRVRLRAPRRTPHDARGRRQVAAAHRGRARRSHRRSARRTAAELTFPHRGPVTLVPRVARVPLFFRQYPGECGRLAARMATWRCP